MNPDLNPIIAPNPTPKFNFMKWAHSHRKWIALGAGVLIAATVGIFVLTRSHPTPPSSTPTQPSQPQSNLVPSPLTGLPVTPNQAKRPVIGVMIENLDPDARPQSGLSQAGVVFETVSEGGITRYLALFQEANPKAIGPVRSLRPYYLSWAMGFDAVIVHAGGSGAALNLVKSLHAKDINALVYGLPTFYRTGDREAPHNLYTSKSLLDKLVSRLGYSHPSVFSPYLRTDNAQPANKPTALDIHIGFSGQSYAVEYRYSKSSNSYRRYLAGKPDVDHLTHRQILVKNIVAIPTPISYDGKYAIIPTVSRGHAVIFRDGRFIKASWRKASIGGQLKLTDQSGKDIALDPGSTWFEIIPQGHTFSY